MNEQLGGAARPLERVRDWERAGRIYLMGATGSRFVKIGFTAYADPTRRILGIQTGCPFRVKLLAHYAAQKKDERDLHLRFRRFLAPARNEWFRDDPSIREHFAERAR